MVGSAESRQKPPTAHANHSASQCFWGAGSRSSAKSGFRRIWRNVLCRQAARGAPNVARHRTARPDEAWTPRAAGFRRYTKSVECALASALANITFFDAINRSQGRVSTPIAWSSFGAETGSRRTTLPARYEVSHAIVGADGTPICSHHWQALPGARLRGRTDNARARSKTSGSDGGRSRDMELRTAFMM